MVLLIYYIIVYSYNTVLGRLEFRLSYAVNWLLSTWLYSWSIFLASNIYFWLLDLNPASSCGASITFMGGYGRWYNSDGHLLLFLLGSATVLSMTYVYSLIYDNYRTFGSTSEIPHSMTMWSTVLSQLLLWLCQLSQWLSLNSIN